MDNKSIVIGLVAGILVGALGIFVLDNSKISRLNNQISSLETENQLLTDAVDIKQDVIDQQQIALDAIEDLQTQYELMQGQLEDWETYKTNSEALIAKLTSDVELLNYLYAAQTYRAEEALTHLHGYDSSYESLINFNSVYAGLSFVDWWNINGGPYEDWRPYVYP
ncbi:MAG: hypothetical protein JSV27_02320 [Candidatus Bathyarchaeota archaeon]|nr:MAG: hypothetical protein JSV27_02320 [Candidatus Bathyarchaeota archaeon]